MMDSKKKLIKKRQEPSEVDSVARNRRYITGKKDIRLLERAHRAWDNMRDVRRQGSRAMRFMYGDQWADEVTVMVKGEKRTMSMREYMTLQGNLPLQSNQIANKVNTMVGILVKEQNEPVCNAIDRDEQQYGEVLTEALKANCNKNRINSIYKLCAKDVFIRGIGVAKEHYGFRECDRRREDTWTDYVDPDYLIMETTLRDPRLWDMTMVGCWYRMKFDVLAAEMDAHGVSYKELKEIYPAEAYLGGEGDDYELTDQEDESVLEFMKPVRRDECCVAEIWTLETKRRVRVHDTNEGTLEIVDADDRQALQEIILENADRTAVGLAAGWAPEEIPLIETEPFIDTYWYCRLMAPDGTVLWEEESQAADRQHPFSIVITPFIDGRISGVVSDSIEHQIAVNRALVLQDWIVRNQVKGFTMIPQQFVPTGMSNEDFVENAIGLGNFMFYDAEKARGADPKVFHPGAVSYNAGDFITQMNALWETSNPVSGAMQGKTPHSGTSAALYAQQTANSSTPIASLLSDIRTFLEDIAIKKVKNIAKFYDADRFAKIAGRIDGIFDNANLNLNDIADIEFDVSIKESNETPMHRMIANDSLMEFFKVGAISLEELLENGYFPFSDRLLQKRQARQAEMEAAQQGEMGEAAQDASQGMAATSGAQDIDLPQNVAGTPKQYGLPIVSKTRDIVQ